LGYVGVVLGGDGLLQALEAVEEAVGEVDVGLLLPVVVGGGDELVKGVVHEGGLELEAEVLVDVVGGVLAVQRQEVEGGRARPGLGVVDLLWRVIEELASFLCTVVYILVHSVGRIESRTVLNLGHWQGNSVSHHP
jgi:hypothetical protein